MMELSLKGPPRSSLASQQLWQLKQQKRAGVCAKLRLHHSEAALISCLLIVFVS